MTKYQKNLVITTIKEINKNPVAIISLAGQIYCPTCINESGIFIELNNGFPSGGTMPPQTDKTMLTSMLEAMQDNYTINSVFSSIKNDQSDFSLIVSIANAEKLYSIEYSSNPTLGSKWTTESANKYVVTNYFLINSWKDLIPKPSNNRTSKGITRKDNLDNLLDKYHGDLDIKGFMQIMDKNISQGGAVWEHTIYQIIYDTNSNNIYIKQNKLDSVWQKFEFKQIFN